MNKFILTIILIFSCLTSFSQPVRTFIKPTAYSVYGTIDNSLPGEAEVQMDFDGDNLDDLAIISNGTDSCYVKIYFGTCYPGFNPVPDSFLVSYIDIGTKLLFADLNNDGKKDFTVMSEHVISSFLNTGTHQYSFSYAIFDTLDKVGHDMVLGDYDLDGNVDLLVSYPLFTTNRWLYFFKGNGNGTFQNSILTDGYAGFDRMYNYNINTDQKADLIVYDAGGSMEVYLNDSAKFLMADKITSYLMPTSIKSFKFYQQANGLLQYAAVGANNVYLGNVDTISAVAVFQTYAMANTVDAVDYGHFDTDANKEYIVSLAGAPYVQLLKWQFTNYITVTPTVAPIRQYSMFITDQNNDSINEIMFTALNYIGVLRYYQNYNFRCDYFIGTGNRPKDVAVADFNHDSLADLAVLNFHEGTVSIFLQGCENGFDPALIDTVINSPNSVQTFTVFDYNHDSFPDLAVCDMATDLHILTGNGDGTFDTAHIFNMTGYAIDIIAADVNNDGWQDLIASQYNNKVSVWKNNATVFSAVDYSMGSTQLFPAYLHYEDYSGDGIADIGTGLTNCPEDVGVLYGDTAGNFSNITSENCFAGFGSYANAPLDLDHDNFPDIAAVSQVDNLFGVFRGGGTGWFIPAVFTMPINGPSDLISGDFNGDGFKDFFISSYINNNVVIIGQKPNGLVYYMGTVYIGSGPRQSCVMDINHDNKPDFLTADENSDDVIILTNDISRPPVLTFQNDSIFVTPDTGYVVTGYEWYLGYTPLFSNTLPYLVPQTSGMYWCTVTMSNGGFSSGSISLLNVGIKNITVDDFEIYPNPASTKINISFKNKSGFCNVSFQNMLGEVVYSKKVNASQGKIDFDVSNFVPGIYFVLVDGVGGRRFMKE